ncbi:hypothetical protein OE88DRAFT_1667953 [Heliocybe sulcata]|uniref:Uncharacterized protein n=1 Tax=Heliocybe sulcata TaxID=5364 RepID=A0A5C3MN61_9AGAM|nr:hypothetical protein OE88DRAFT_1667953 [Heliocybe sulcata]
MSLSGLEVGFTMGSIGDFTALLGLIRAVSFKLGSFRTDSDKQARLKKELELLDIVVCQASAVMATYRDANPSRSFEICTVVETCMSVVNSVAVRMDQIERIVKEGSKGPSWKAFFTCVALNKFPREEVLFFLDELQTARSRLKAILGLVPSNSTEDSRNAGPLSVNRSPRWKTLGYTWEGGTELGMEPIMLTSPTGEILPIPFELCTDLHALTDLAMVYLSGNPWAEMARRASFAFALPHQDVELIPVNRWVLGSRELPTLHPGMSITLSVHVNVIYCGECVAGRDSLRGCSMFAGRWWRRQKTWPSTLAKMLRREYPPVIKDLIRMNRRMESPNRRRYCIIFQFTVRIPMVRYMEVYSPVLEEVLPSGDVVVHEFEC